MICRQAGQWLNAYIDSELDFVRGVEVEEHVSGCSSCRNLLDEYEFLRNSFQSDDLRFNAPRDLERKIRREVRRAPSQLTSPRAPGWYWSAACACFATALVAVTLPFWTKLAVPAGNQMAQEIVTNHIRSLLADHLMDVPSTDRHTVKPWFNGRLDFSPAVKDLSAEGFPLKGGRLDYLEKRRVAALVYKRRQHLINLFEWPGGAKTDLKPEIGASDGYNHIRWSHSGMNYWAVSDLSREELMAFVREQQR